MLVWASSGGSGETARMRRLAWTFAARIGDKYQIRLTRSICRTLQWTVFLYFRFWKCTSSYQCLTIYNHKWIKYKNSNDLERLGFAWNCKFVKLQFQQESKFTVDLQWVIFYAAEWMNIYCWIAVSHILCSEVNEHLLMISRVIFYAAEWMNIYRWFTASHFLRSGVNEHLLLICSESFSMQRSGWTLTV